MQIESRCLLIFWSSPCDSYSLKADFQSSHEAPRSSLRVMHEHFHPITMLKS